MEEVRVRFPPSPTGYLHIGSARTALVNWLFCRRAGGRFVLRIEDTDVERSTGESAQAILDGLRWMGIDWDEGPYLQSEYAHEHRAAAGRLRQAGAAYRCYCAREDLERKREAARAGKLEYGYDRACRDLSPEQRARYEAEGRPSVVRFRAPDREGTVAFDDMVYGRYEVRHAQIEDFVIVRSGGEPLYVLSNVVDDRRDRITHVIRGADHLPNTPKQVLLYRALGWPIPSFGHIPLTLDPKKAKISKRRHGEVVTVRFYEEAGFLPWAFCNFVALLGWSPGDDREVFLTREDLLEAFEIGRITRTNSVFNYNRDDPRFFTDPKAIHINAQHVRSLPLLEIVPHVRDRLQRAGLWRTEWEDGGEGRDWFLRTVDLLRARFHVLNEFLDLGRAYFADDYPMDEAAVQKSLRGDPAVGEHLSLLAERFSALDPFDLASTEAALRGLALERGVPAGSIINAARVVVTGQGKGPGIFDVFCAVGRQRTVDRLRRVAREAP